MRFLLITLASLAFVGCSDKGGADTDPPLNTGKDVTTPATDETGVSTTETAVPSILEVIAIGWEFDGVWDQENKTLGGYLFPDIYGTYGYTPYRSPTVYITLASQDYFSAGGTGPPDASLYCLVAASFDGVDTTLDPEAYDYDKGQGSTGVKLPYYGFFEGTLTVIGMTDECNNLDPAVYPGGEPTSTLDGMHFGVGFGPLSPYLETTLSEAFGEPDWTDNQMAYISQFIAINEPGELFPHLRGTI